MAARPTAGPELPVVVKAGFGGQSFLPDSTCAGGSGGRPLEAAGALDSSGVILARFG